VKGRDQVVKELESGVREQVVERVRECMVESRWQKELESGGYRAGGRKS
jgi:hypothetical protein